MSALAKSSTQTLENDGSFLTGWRLIVTQVTLLLVSVICQVDRILPFILAESIKRDLNLNDMQLGLITGIAFAVCYSLMVLPLARLADLRSPRFVLILCTLLWSVMTALGGLATSFMFLALTRFGVAFGEAGAIPAGHALIARTIKPESRGLAIGLFSMGIPLGAMIGFAVGGQVSDIFGWRVALLGAGAVGGLVALLAVFLIGATPPKKRITANAEPFLKSSLKLLLLPAFRWLFIAAILLGFASAPFYAFSAPFLIRTYGYSTSEVGLAFGVLQGLMGISGTLVAGRRFDRSIRLGTHQLLQEPAILFLVASLTTLLGLFAPVGWLSILLLIPGMLSFSFLLPWAFGAAHFVAGPGKQALASSLVLMGSSLVGPTVGPFMVGLISDTATAFQVANGLRWGLLIVPVSSALLGFVLLRANQALKGVTAG